jgi:hypothetical protein
VAGLTTVSPRTLDFSFWCDTAGAIFADKLRFLLVIDNLLRRRFRRRNRLWNGRFFFFYGRSAVDNIERHLRYRKKKENL